MLTEYLVGDAEAADQQRSRAEEEALRRSRRRRDRRACRKEEIEEREGETGRREGRGDATRGRSCEGDGRGGRAGHGRRVGEEMPLQARSAEEERGGLRECRAFSSLEQLLPAVHMERAKITHQFSLMGFGQPGARVISGRQ